MENFGMVLEIIGMQDSDVAGLEKSEFGWVLLADGRKKVRVLGKVKVEFTLNKRRFFNYFHVKESPIDSIIIGNDFLRSKGAVIDFGTNQLLLNNNFKLTPL